MSTGVPNPHNSSAGSGRSGAGSDSSNVPLTRKFESAAAQLHGAGEAIRGEFNSAVNRTVGDRQGEEIENANIARGNREMATGRIESGGRSAGRHKAAGPATAGPATAGPATASKDDQVADDAVNTPR